MKRKIAAALAIVMVGAQYATPFVNAAETTTVATVDVDGSAAVATLDDSVVKVVVPTTKALNFTLDPEGLLAVADGTVDGTDEDALKPYSGRILGNTALVFANKSIRPVTVTTKFQVDGVTDDQVVDTKAAVKKENSTTANLLFMAVPNKTKIALTYGTGEGVSSSEALADINNHTTANSFSTVAADVGYVFTKTATTVKSVIPEAAHTISFTDGTDGGTFDYTLDTNKSNSAAGFIISGFCNPYGDYSSVGSVKVKASYSFQKATATEASDGKINSTFAVISAKQGESNATVEDINANGITTKKTVKAVTSSGSSVAELSTSTTYDISSGASAVSAKITDATAITAVTMKYNTSNIDVLTTTDAFTFDKSTATLTIKPLDKWGGTKGSTYATNFAALGTSTTATITATVNGKATTKTITLKLK